MPIISTQKHNQPGMEVLPEKMDRLYRTETKGAEHFKSRRARSLARCFARKRLN
jgi:hypothetical protein